MKRLLLYLVLYVVPTVAMLAMWSILDYFDEKHRVELFVASTFFCGVLNLFLASTIADVEGAEDG